jgi:hypothetical protein
LTATPNHALQRARPSGCGYRLPNLTPPLINALVLIFGALISSAMAEEKMAAGGKSPDGQYEVRIARESGEPSDYGLHIHSTQPAKRIFRIPDTGGYLRFEAAVERDHAYWHPSSRCVAITDQGTRHSRELHIIYIDEGGKASVLGQPDFYQNALGRVGAVKMDFACVVTPQKWDGDDLILGLHFTANGRRTYDFEIVLHLSHGPATVPKLQLKSVQKTKEGGG